MYGVSKRDAETLLALDDFELKGVRYFEEVTGGEGKLGKRAVNWCVLLDSVKLMPGSHMSCLANSANRVESGIPRSSLLASCEKW